MPGAHALLSPSGASRWLVCKPSARLEQNFAESSSEFADEGTLAHDIGEILINNKKLGAKFPYHDTNLAKLQGRKHWSVSMQAYCEDYSDYVIERFNAAKKTDPNAQLYVETSLDLSDYIPESFGRLDVCIMCAEYIEIIDLKFGKGVPVSAIENKQLMIYGLGAYKRFALFTAPKRLIMTIYQPRLDNISEWSIAMPDLLLWAEEKLKPAAAKAFIGEGEFLPGDHCKFCRAKALCKANASYSTDFVTPHIENPDLLSDEEVVKILIKLDNVQAYVKALKEYALDQAVSKGKKWPGFKLVRGRSNRVITDKAKAAAILEGMFLDPALIYTEPELKGLTDLEAAVSKKLFNAQLGHLVGKPLGAPTLVPESDKREEMNNAAEALKDFDGFEAKVQLPPGF